MKASGPLARQVGGTHYQSKGVQHTTFCQRNRIPWNEACAIKYLTRWKKKHGLQDLEKAKHYLEFAIQEEYLLREEAGFNQKTDMDPDEFPIQIDTFLRDNEVGEVEADIIHEILQHQQTLGETTLIRCVEKIDALIAKNANLALLD